jgi:hypothetical protein
MQGPAGSSVSDGRKLCGKDILLYRDAKDFDRRKGIKRQEIINQLAFLIQPPFGLAFIAMQEVPDLLIKGFLPPCMPSKPMYLVKWHPCSVMWIQRFIPSCFP